MMDMQFYNGLMANSTKESGQMVKEMATESKHGQMVRNTKGSG